MTQYAGITLRLQSADQLLLPPTASFPCKRSLNEDAEEYIIEQAGLLPRRVPITLTVIIPADEVPRAEEIAAAVHRHFAFRRERSEQRLKQTLQLGWRSLLVGFVFLAIIILLAELGSRILPAGGLAVTVRESLVIIGWVALWRPAELLLYEWYPFKREIRLFNRLARSKVQVVTEAR